MTDTLAERLLERWEYIQSVQRNVDAYSGNEAAGNAEILRLKAKFADEARAALEAQASLIAEKDEALAEIKALAPTGLVVEARQNPPHQQQSTLP